MKYFHHNKREQYAGCVKRILVVISDIQ